MVTFVNAQTASLAARRQLDASGSALAVSVRRLASGLRVNSARDDAAGLAIAERLTSRLRGSAMALRNANDGLSLFHTADGALGEMSGLLQRMRERVVQALNASNAAPDRRSLDADLRQALAEFDRQAQTTRFNGRQLLAGSTGAACFQLGAASADGVDFNVDAAMRGADIGAIASATSCDLRTLNNSSGGFPFAATYTTVAISGLDFSRPALPFSGGLARTVGTPASNYSGGQAAQFTVDGDSVTLNADYGSLAGVAAAVQGQLDASRYVVAQDGVHLSIGKTPHAAASTVAPAISAVSGANAAVFAGATGTPGNAAAPTTNAGFAVDGRRVSLVADHTGDFDALVADIQRQLDGAARGAYRVSGSGAGLSITRSTGVEPPTVGGFSGAGASVFASAPRTGITLGAGDLQVQVGQRPPVSVTGSFFTPAALAEAVRLQVGHLTASINAGSGALEIDAAEAITLSGAAADPSGLLAFTRLANPPEGSLEDVTAQDTDLARRSLLRIDVAIAAVSAQRSLFGATESRFEAIAAGLQADVEQAAATRGRIIDADYAAETASLARQRVLQQAALAMVAQANLMPQDVLALMR